MADHRIVCCNAEHPHRHITHVGTGETLKHYQRIWTVSEATKAIEQGDTFHTISPVTGERAEVHPYSCNIDGCTVQTLRSVKDLTADNNLDDLANCVL
jgi:Protein of unknown function (DUF3892)